MSKPTGTPVRSTSSESRRVDDLVEDVATSINEGLLPVWAYSDPGIHQRELENIFTRAWVFVGHESEIPSRGDYVQRLIGLDRFVLVRGEDGQVRLLFDSCRHRGALICRAEKGNASHFRCSYHGWTYNNAGDMVGAPIFGRAYGKGLDKDKWSLYKAAQVESIHGLIFATLDPDAPTLTEYLGDMKWYMDMEWGQLKDGWEVVGEPQRWILDTNWKIGSENFSGDDYHTLFLHRSMAELGFTKNSHLKAWHIQAGNGHSISHFMSARDVPGVRFWGYDAEFAEQAFDPEKMGPDMYDVAKHTIGNVGNVFPNFAFLSFPLPPSSNVPAQPTKVIRVFQPTSSGTTEVLNWVLVPKGMPEEQRILSQRAVITTFGSSGLFDQDDSEPWGSMNETSRSVFARKVGMRTNFRMGLPGVGEATQVFDYPGPGVAYFPALEEGVMRGFWRRWSRFISNGEYPQAMSPEAQDGQSSATTTNEGAHHG